MSRTTTKCRIHAPDNELLKAVAFKLSGELSRVVTTADVLNALFKYADPSGQGEPDEIVKKIKPYFT